MKCPICGNEIPSEAAFCGHCGLRLNPHSDEQAEPEEPAAPTAAPTITAAPRSAPNAKLIACVLLAFVIVGAVLLNQSGTRKASSESYTSSSSSTYTSVPKTGNVGALSKAEAYLSSGSGFSEEGLRDQLDYEGFSSSEIDYAIRNCSADWKAQCLKKAKAYLSRGSGFSEEGLEDQLEYEEFASTEISYAIKNCGADWNDQCAKKAKAYVKSNSKFTKSSLRSQLNYEGFTSSQIDYGLKAAGF